MAASLALLLATLATPPPGEPETLRGQVVAMPEVLASLGLRADPEPLARQVALRTEGGEVVPLLSDEASRALFADPRLRNRPAELRIRRPEGLPYAQVLAVRVEDAGKLRTPEYYCDICTIGVRYPQDCPCCQGPMELRMKPDR